MKDTDYNESEMLTREYQRESRQREAIKQQMQPTVLATIDELNQYLLGNVTLEAATDATRELTYALLEVFVASLDANNSTIESK